MAKGNRKLTEEQVHEIRCWERKRAHYEGLAKLYKRENIAKQYGVSYSVITSVVDKTAYADIPDKYCAENE
jgi:transposase